MLETGFKKYVISSELHSICKVRDRGETTNKTVVVFIRGRRRTNSHSSVISQPVLDLGTAQVPIESLLVSN